MTKTRFKVAHKLAKIKPMSKRSVQMARARCVICPDLPVPGSRPRSIATGFLDRSRDQPAVKAELVLGDLI
jgi:hypothetical protein